MKNLVLLVSFVLSCVCASAQKVFFIYLQSDNYRPFYVKMNDKIYSSTTSGYLILSKAANDTTLLYAVVYTKEPDVVVQQQQAPAPEENKKVEEKPLAVDSTAVVSSTVMVADTKKEDVGTTVQSNGDVKKEAGIIG